MKKISSLFARDPNNPRVLTDDFHPDAAWVVAGEGVATRKLDGTSVLVRGGKLFARYDVKRGKTSPANFEPAQDPDPNTGHHPGWVHAERPEDKWIREAAINTAATAVAATKPLVYRPGAAGQNALEERVYTDWNAVMAEAAKGGIQLEDGTYEACGPKINGNPERLTDHYLYRHGNLVLGGVPRDKAGLIDYFNVNDIEGVVWWRVRHDDACDKIKITAESLGVKRPSIR